MKIKEVKLKNLYTLACLNINYGTTEQKPKIQWLQKWWNLSKLVINTLASLFLAIFLVPQSSSLPADKKYKKRVGEMVTSSCLEW